MSNFKKGSVASILMILEEVLKRMVGLISTLILARILLPEDFGIIAIASIVMGLFEVLATSGSDDYLLRVEKLDDNKINTAWTINFILKTVASLLMILASFIAVEYYADPRLFYLITAFSLIFFANNFINPALAYLKREQEYAKIVKLSIVTKVVASTVAVVAAITLESYWALVLGKLAATISMIIGSYIIYRYKPKFQLTNATDQWQFSGWMIPQAIFGYTRTQLDTFLVSSSFGQAALGSYYTIKYVAYIPSAYFLSPITRPFLVELTKARVDQRYFNKQYNASFILIMLLAAPISAVMYIYDDLVTNLLLGENWLEYAYLMGIFGLLLPAYVMFHHSARALMVFSKTKQLFIYECIAFFCIYTPLLLIGIEDLAFFSFFRVMAEVVMSLIFLVVVSVIYTSFKNALLLVFSLVPMAFAILVAAQLTLQLVNVQVNVLLDLASRALVFTVTYTSVMLACHCLLLRRLSDWLYLESLVLRIVKPVLNRVIKKGNTE